MAPVAASQPAPGGSSGLCSTPCSRRCDARPAGIEATLRAIEHASSEHQTRVRSAELELERVQIHTERARRQFDTCEPENRLVARTLEREWEQRLADVRRAEHGVADVAARRPDPLTNEEIAWCRQAGADLRKVFDAPTTSDRERKQLLRAILADVVVTVDRESEPHAAQLRVVWEGGAVTQHSVTAEHRQSHPMHRPGHDRARPPARRALPRQADRSDPCSPRTTDRRWQPVHRHNVHGLRTSHKIPAAPVRPAAQGDDMVTIASAANQLGVSTATVHRWLREGFITGEQITPGAPWQIQLTDELSGRVCEHAPDGWLPLTQAANALGSPARPCCTRSNATSLCYVSEFVSESAVLLRHLVACATML